MNAILKQVLKTAENWSREGQAELADYARVIEARRAGFYPLDEDELSAIEEGIRQADCDEFAADAMKRLAGRFGA